MKRLPIIVLTLALCLLTAACGAKPNEPDDGDSAKAGIVERMATVTAEEIKYVPSFVADVSLNAEEVASILNEAAEHRSKQPDSGLHHYTMKIYLSGGPDAYSSSDEHFVFFAGLDENHINGIYFNGKGDSHRMSFEDETLYWLIRNSYRTEEHVDKDIIRKKAINRMNKLQNLTQRKRNQRREIKREERDLLYSLKDGTYCPF